MLISNFVQYVSKVENAGEKTEAFENLEQDVFKALENQKRRDILRLIGEKKALVLLRSWTRAK